MKTKIKRFIALTLVFITLAAFLSGTASAIRIGDKLGNVLNSDIKVYIDGVQIAGYTVNNGTYIIAEELIPYGFKVVWDGAARSLSVTDGTSRGKPKAVPENKVVSGSVAFPYLYTDITAYINGKWVVSYSIQGSTVICIDDLAKEFGYLSWNGKKRELRLLTKYSLFSSAELTRINEINQKLADIAPKAKSVYTVEPDAKPPYNIGKINRDFLNDGLAYVNFARYMAGLPSVALSDTLNNTAQQGAFVLFATNQFSHYPTNTANLPDELFSLGANACSSSNIGSGHESLYSFNRSCMDDSDSSNIDRVGHRRWLLSPRMGYIGMGRAGGKMAVYVFDTSANFTGWDTINWPSAGLFPRKEFSAYTAWSVSLGNNYKTSGDTEVKIVRKSDGKTWTLSQNSSKTGREYFNVSESNLGDSGTCIIFRPNVSEYKISEEYEVTITGLTGSSSKARTLQYTVKFF